MLKGDFVRNITSILLTVLASALVMGCSSENKSSNAGANVGVNGGCPLGSTPSNGVCIGQNGMVTQPGTNPTTGVGTSARFYSENWKDRNFEIPVTGYTAYESFIQNAMGVCGPYTQTGIPCSEWVTGAMDMVLLSDNVQANQATIVFRLKPRGYGYGFAPRVLPLNFTLSVTNNYQGFEGRAYGDYGSPANRSLIQLQVAVGKLQDNSFEYRMAYRGEIIMTGRFQKCGSADCGLSKDIGL